MNFQLALDRLTREQCFQLLRETESSVDWIEVGTGVIKEYGMAIVRDIKAAYPEKILVADMKTCDAGKHEAIQAFEAGADITTVMAFSADKTITETLKVAEQYGKRIMIDLLGVKEPERLSELQNLGVDLVSLHYGKDMQLDGEMKDDLFSLTENLEGIEIAIAGGINKKSLADLLDKPLQTVIIGSAVTAAPDPGLAAKELKGVMNQHEINH
ncbi:3-hexulose-6-phosphate synthase [Planomicrobium okeanokoites]|uniref:3-hexulose-6-phosphate synthase n=1 Tax=Planomicrobium okeanokoites TaxID=244 RepID=UPI0035679E33